MPFFIFPIIFVLFIVLLAIFARYSSKIIGSSGEKRVNAIINSLGEDYILVPDLMIRNSRGVTAQIDHVVLSEYGIFVIETKTYSGWIFGNEQSEEWKKITKRTRYSFRNPVKQNWGHVYALKEILKQFPNCKYYPIVVFAGTAELKDITSKVPVVYSDDLKSTIENYCSTKCFSKDEVLQIKDILENARITDEDAEKEHVKAVRQQLDERQLKIENLICPKCNGELKLRTGKYGKFYGCSNYPACKFTTPY